MAEARTCSFGSCLEATRNRWTDAAPVWPRAVGQDISLAALFHGRRRRRRARQAPLLLFSRSVAVAAPWLLDKYVNVLIALAGRSKGNRLRTWYSNLLLIVQSRPLHEMKRRIEIEREIVSRVKRRWISHFLLGHVQTALKVCLRL
jgi:hypothetical protein